jgi:hypothetical protein
MRRPAKVRIAITAVRRDRPIGVFIRGGGYGGPGEGAYNPTQPSRGASESAGGAMDEPQRRHPQPASTSRASIWRRHYALAG